MISEDMTQTLAALRAAAEEARERLRSLEAALAGRTDLEQRIRAVQDTLTQLRAQIDVMDAAIIQLKNESR